MTRLDEGGGLSLAPDVTRPGGCLAFVSNRHARLRAVMPAAQSSELYVRRPEWGLGRRLTRDGGLKYTPRWSPDGKTLAYFSLNGESSGIHIVAVDAGAPRRLFARGTFPTWRPDGQAIVPILGFVPLQK